MVTSLRVPHAHADKPADTQQQCNVTDVVTEGIIIDIGMKKRYQLNYPQAHNQGLPPTRWVDCWATPEDTS